MGKIKIALDLDGVIIDKPPFLPKQLIEKLFRGNKGDRLFYRFPKIKLEILIRKISHFYLFRPPIKENLEFIRKIAQNPSYELYILSGRYSFLERETLKLLKKHNLLPIFKEIYLNLKNEQPHLFKEKILRQLKPQLFVDDDFLLADYLVNQKITKIFFYSRYQEKASKAITINRLEEIIER